MSVAIIGGRGSGKTVFLSLLATTAISYSVESKEHFRYYTSPEYTAVVHEIISSLKLKRWPPATLKGTLLEYKFYFGYSKRLADLLNRLYNTAEGVMSYIKRIEIPRRELYNIIEFSVYDIAGEDVDAILQAASIAKERGIPVVDLIPETLRAVFDCDVLVFLIDSSRISIEHGDPKYEEMLRYDGLMASLTSTVIEYKAKSMRRKLFPVFVFTKFDEVDKKVLRYLGISEDLNMWFRKMSRNRDEINERLIKFMSTFFEHSRALINGGTLHGVELERGQAFVSYLMTELNEDGVSVPKVVKNPDGVSYDLLYSVSEYIRFIDYFGKISNEIKKSTKEPGYHVTGVGR